jgi:hypothetical protein
MVSWFSIGAFEITQRLKSIILSHSSTQNQDCLAGFGVIFQLKFSLVAQVVSSEF